MEEALQDRPEKIKKMNQEVEQIETDLIEQGHILKDWFVFRDERHFGPMSTKDLRHLLSKKLIATSHFVWRPGFPQWTAIGELECFRSYGKKEACVLSDDDFSKKAMLSGIDRISWERNEIDFIDKTKADAYELQKLRSSRLSRGQSLDLSFSEKLTNFFGLFGPSFANGKLLSLGLAALFVFSGLMSLDRTSEEDQLLEGFSTAVKERMTRISNKSEKATSSDFEIFDKKSLSGDTVLIASTNLPLGSRILIDIQGDPGTLLGAYRFNKKIELNLESKIFSTEALREASGKFIPPGKYSVVASCLTCAKDELSLFAKDFTFGVSDRAIYNRELSKFHEETRQNAKLELMELGDLSENLNQQFSKTNQKFARAFTEKRIAYWDRFSSGWLVNQRKLIDLFEQMKSGEFQASLYYLSLYTAYNKTIKDIFELHILQDEMIKNDLSDQEQIFEESKLSQKINLELKSLKSQLDLMNVNFNKTNGLPEKTGLEL